jgi:hypothetical protein
MGQVADTQSVMSGGIYTELSVMWVVRGKKKKRVARRKGKMAMTLDFSRGFWLLPDSL